MATQESLTRVWTVVEWRRMRCTVNDKRNYGYAAAFVIYLFLSLLYLGAA
jgi:hypothetical protein